MKTYLILWLSGLIAGVLVMERWRRTGRGLVTPADRAEEAVETPTANTPSAVSLDKPSVPAVLVAGAKADAVRIHYFVKRVTPWTSTPAPPPPSCEGGVEWLHRSPVPSRLLESVASSQHAREGFAAC